MNENIAGRHATHQPTFNEDDNAPRNNLDSQHFSTVGVASSEKNDDVAVSLDARDKESVHEREPNGGGTNNPDDWGVSNANQKNSSRHSPVTEVPPLYAEIEKIHPRCRSYQLHDYIWKGDNDAVKAFINLGTKINYVDSFRRTPLLIAACCGFTDVVSTLLMNGAEVNGTDASGNTCLILATDNRRQQIVEILLQNESVDVNCRGAEGNTALIVAARHGCLDVVKLLLAHRADPGIRNHEGESALNIAERNGHMNVVQHLNTLSEVEILQNKLDEGSRSGEEDALPELMEAEAMPTLEPSKPHVVQRTVEKESSSAVEVFHLGGVVGSIYAGRGAAAWCSTATLKTTMIQKAEEKGWKNHTLSHVTIGCVIDEKRRCYVFTENEWDEARLRIARKVLEMHLFAEWDNQVPIKKELSLPLSSLEDTGDNIQIVFFRCPNVSSPRPFILTTCIPLNGCSIKTYMYLREVWASDEMFLIRLISVTGMITTHPLSTHLEAVLCMLNQPSVRKKNSVGAGYTNQKNDNSLIMYAHIVCDCGLCAKR